MQTVTVTYREIFDRVWDSLKFGKIGVNEWVLNEGLALPEDTKTLTKDQALVFMNEHEFEARKNQKG